MPRRRREARKSIRKKTTVASARRATVIGRNQADEVLRFRDSALRRRTAALRRAAPAASAVRVVSPRLIRAAGGPARSGVLVAEGDSWVDYPWHDVLRMLADPHGYDVESVADKGDSIESMAYSGQLVEFRRLIEQL